jgi:hypothetical protein
MLKKCNNKQQRFYLSIGREERQVDCDICMQMHTAIEDNKYR